MSTAVTKLYASRYEDFRRMQESLTRLTMPEKAIDLHEIAEDKVWLDDDEVLTISTIPAHGDYVFVTVNTDALTKGKPIDWCFYEVQISITTLSMKVLDELLRAMKKAIIISEIRNLH